MKPSGFTKYIPITETEYQKFREYKQKQAKLVQEELARPAAVLPLVEAKNEMTRTLFEKSNTPDIQEQRYKELFNIITDLKRQVENPRELTAPEKRIKESEVPAESVPARKTRSIVDRKRALRDRLGNNIWNEQDELVLDGTPVPGSSKDTLIDYATSSWRTKYNNNTPPGGSPLLEIIREKNISPNLLGKKVQEKSQVQGFATKTSKKRRMNIQQKSERKKLIGENVLANSKNFAKFLNTR